ncbi:hypothetical protein PIB30_035904 [Stylosanthes scabra]|uniref:Uncharacterized protein n=1 Tax=Stylosanthes scabra TaxID=79078 RepID=A0ABU6WBB6_9FABA|nr:hypothetical protein [Stylosanthes scabra]
MEVEALIQSKEHTLHAHKPKGKKISKMLLNQRKHQETPRNLKSPCSKEMNINKQLKNKSPSSSWSMEDPRERERDINIKLRHPGKRTRYSHKASCEDGESAPEAPTCKTLPPSRLPKICMSLGKFSEDTQRVSKSSAHRSKAHNHKQYLAI